MKKVIVLTLTTLMLSLTSFSQKQSNLSFGVGVSYFDFSSTVGQSFTLELDRYHFDVANCFLNKNNNYNIGVYNVGYKFPFNKKCTITPLIGVGWSQNINKITKVVDQKEYTFYENGVAHFNYGATLNCKVSNRFSYYLGIGKYERFKSGIIVKLF